MNVNCAGGTDWSRNQESNCSVENLTAAVHEAEDSNVVLGGPRTEGKASVFTL